MPQGASFHKLCKIKTILYLKYTRALDHVSLHKMQVGVKYLKDFRSQYLVILCSQARATGQEKKVILTDFKSALTSRPYFQESSSCVMLGDPLHSWALSIVFCKMDRGASLVCSHHL